LSYVIFCLSKSLLGYPNHQCTHEPTFQCTPTFLVHSLCTSLRIYAPTSMEWKPCFHFHWTCKFWNLWYMVQNYISWGHWTTISTKVPHVFFPPYIFPQVLMQIIYLYAYIVKSIFWIVIIPFQNDIIYVLVFNNWHFLLVFIKIFMLIPCWKKNGFFNMHT